MDASNINSDTETADLYAIYVDAQNYDIDGSAEAAKDFMRAARALLAQIVKGKVRSVDVGGVPVTFDAPLIERQIQQAKHWLSANDANYSGGRRGSVHHYDMRFTRD